MEAPASKARAIWEMSLSVAKWAIGVLAVLIVLFLAINVFDEDPSPETKALLIAPPNPYKPQENLYLALMGFKGPPDSSLIVIGEERVAAYEKELAEALKDPEHVFPGFMEKGERLEFQGQTDFCRPLNKSCLAEVESHRTEIERLLRTNSVLMQRYSRLHELRGYHETATPSIYSLTFFVPPAVRQLYLANIVLRVKTGARSQQKAALGSLRDDIRTWRSMLNGSGSLISKMVAIASLQGDFATLADIVAEGKIDLAGISPEIRAALDIVKEDDWKMGSIYAHEFRTSAYMWDQLRAAKNLRLIEPSEDTRWWERLSDQITTPFLKINATQNLQALEAVQRKLEGDAAPGMFLTARDNYRKWRKENVDFGVRYIYNPAGKFLLGIGWDSYENYSLRAYDGAAFLRLVRLGYEIRSRKIEDEKIPAFMQWHPDWATHPVDGRPFVWDRHKREIAVPTLGNQPKDRRFHVSVWSAGR